MHTATVPISPSSSPMAENTKSVDALGIFCGLPSPSPVPVEAAACRARTSTARVWKPVVCDDRPRVDPRAAPGPARGRTAGTRSTAPPTNRPNATMRYERPLGGDVEHRGEHREEQQRRAEVLLAAPSPGSRSPTRAAAGPRCFGSGSAQPADVARARREQLALVDEVRGEEHHQQHLGGLARLEVERAEAHPEAGAVDLLADAGEQRQQQRARRRGAGTCTCSARACGCGARARA